MLWSEKNEELVKKKYFSTEEQQYSQSQRPNQVVNDKAQPDIKL
jgi:hypothetical protein